MKIDTLNCKGKAGAEFLAGTDFVYDTAASETAVFMDTITLCVYSICGKLQRQTALKVPSK